MAKTLFDKIWESHLVDVQDDGTCLLYIDRHLVHEVTSPQAFEALKVNARKLRRPDLTLATVDHNIPTAAREKFFKNAEKKTGRVTTPGGCGSGGCGSSASTTPNGGCGSDSERSSTPVSTAPVSRADIEDLSNYVTGYLEDKDSANQCLTLEQNVKVGANQGLILRAERQGRSEPGLPHNYSS